MEDIQTYLLSGIPILLLLWWYRSRRPTKYPPGPFRLPLIGNLLNVAGSDILQSLRDLRQHYGDVFSLSLGRHHVIVVNGASTLREVLIKNAEFTSDRPDIPLFRIFRKRGKHVPYQYLPTLQIKVFFLDIKRNKVQVIIDRTFLSMSFVYYIVG